jgi:hypothetical protein
MAWQIDIAWTVAQVGGQANAASTGASFTDRP